MKRKMVSFLLIFLLLAGLVPQGVFAAETEILTTTAEEKAPSKDSNYAVGFAEHGIHIQCC